MNNNEYDIGHGKNLFTEINAENCNLFTVQIKNYI